MRKAPPGAFLFGGTHGSRRRIATEALKYLMRRRPDIDAACGHLASYLRRDPWPSFRQQHLLDFLGSIPASHDLDVEGVFQEVHQAGHLASMIGFLDEAFLSGEHGPERLNPVDDYLRRRGWQETPRAREYLKGIRNTPPGLFEVQDVAFGEWVEVRDRLRDGPRERVIEHSASQSLQRWDCLVARVVTARGERLFTGGTLSLSRETGAEMEDLFQRIVKTGRKSVAAAEHQLGLAPGTLGGVDAATASFTDRILFHVWLQSLLAPARRPLPQLQNTDGDPLLLARTRLRVTSGATDEVVRGMDQLAGWEREPDGDLRWTWLAGGGSQPATVRATARIEQDWLLVETNSRRRMELALAAFQETIGSLVTALPTSYEDPALALAQRAARDRHDDQPPAPDISAEDLAAMNEIMLKAKDTHYRRTLDEPVPMLGNKTPRQCRRSQRGRALLVNWLKELENHELRQAAESGTAPYSMHWMWRELGVDGEH